MSNPAAKAVQAVGRGKGAGRRRQYPGAAGLYWPGKRTAAGLSHDAESYLYKCLYRGSGACRGGPAIRVHVKNNLFAKVVLYFCE